MPVALLGNRLGAAVRLAQPSTSGKQSILPATTSGRFSLRQRLLCTAIAYDERATASSTALPQNTSPAPSVVPMTNGASPAASKSGEQGVNDKELSRRMKISAANRGRTPWNKGRSLPESVREKIRQRTFEAMQRPDVRARMAEANQHRPPHREEVKERIRHVLKERVAEAKGVINVHALQIVEAMRESSNPEEREAAAQEDAVEIVSRVTWRFIKRDFDETFEKWQTDDNGFRTYMVARFKELAERGARKKASGGTRKRTSVSSASKVRRAVATQKKLDSAKEKLAQAERALANVLPMKSKLAGNPEALQKVLNIEAAVPKLRDQVEALTEAMAPLQQYLTPNSAAEFVMQQQAAAEEAAAAASNGNGHVNGNGAAAVAAAAAASANGAVAMNR